MKYTPEKNKTAKLISLAALLVACALIGTLFLKVRYQVVYEVIALLFYLFSFELLYRFVFTTYTYIIDEGNFIVMKQTGKRQMYVCNIAMSTALAPLVRTPKTKEERAAFAERFGRVKIRYNYCQVIAPKETYSYLFEFNGETAEIVFQPNEEMRAMIRTAAERAEENAL